MFASTNLVFEIGIVLWVFLGPAFTAAEFAGDLLLILLNVGPACGCSSPRARSGRFASTPTGSRPATSAIAAGRRSLREKLGSVEAWSDVAHNFRGDWRMIRQEITIGFLIAGYVALLPETFFQAIFLDDAPAALKTAQNVLVGPLITVLSFRLLDRQQPLAAVLCSRGIAPMAPPRAHSSCGRPAVVRREELTTLACAG
jgi:uncharacterized protein